MLIDGREWKLVPVEPTGEMLHILTGQWHSSRHQAAQRIYAAMLAAAPTPPAAPAASADLGGLTDAEIDAIWTRPVSATASATVIRRETAELLIRAAALKAAPVAAQVPQDDFSGVRPPMRYIAGVNVGVLERAARAQSAAPTPPPLGDDCDDVDAILRIVGLDPERCRTEGGALNVGRTRTLWEDVVSPAAQPAAASPDFPHYEMAFICRVLEGDHPEKADLDTALGMARSVRVALLKERAAQAPAASADLGGLTDAEIDAIWTRPVSATASATVIRRETAELLIRAAALKAAPVVASADPVAVLRFDRGTPGRENEMPTVVSCNRLPDGEYAVYLAPVAAQAPRPCTCHPDDKPRGPCREKYAASECQAPEHLLYRLRKHADDDRNSAFARSTMREALQYLEAAQAPAANGDAPTARELDMAMLIKRLAATLRVAWPESTYMKAADDAMDALNRWGLAGSPLREGG